MPIREHGPLYLLDRPQTGSLRTRATFPCVLTTLGRLSRGALAQAALLRARHSRCCCCSETWALLLTLSKSQLAREGAVMLLADRRLGLANRLLGRALRGRALLGRALLGTLRADGLTDDGRSLRLLDEAHELLPLVAPRNLPH